MRAQRYAEALRRHRSQDKNITLLITESSPKLLDTFADVTMTIERGEIGRLGATGIPLSSPTSMRRRQWPRSTSIGWSSTGDPLHMLNGLDPHARLKATDRAKIVVDLVGVWQPRLPSHRTPSKSGATNSIGVLSLHARGLTWVMISVVFHLNHLSVLHKH
jgi:hypothetical protein